MAAAVPDLLVEMTVDDADDPTPTWVDVTAYVRGFSTNRGRDSELSRVSAGTARVVLSNADRSFDPTDDVTLRPMNRWRISAALSGGDEPVFMGYAESYEQQWPAYGKDAVTVVSLVDEFKVLALDRLATTDPPRDTYADVIAFDQPYAYWEFGPSGNADFRVMAPTIGQGHFVNQFGSYAGEDSPILGAYSERWTALGAIAYANARESTGGFPIVDLNPYLESGTLGMGASDPGNMAGLSAFTIEVWFKSSEATPAANRYILQGPYSNDGTQQYQIQISTTGKVVGVARNSSATAFTATGATSIAANTWYHVALVVNGSNTLIYLNGVQDGSASWSGVPETMDITSYLQLGDSSVPGGIRYWDELAVYRGTLTASRLLAHYEAGALLAFGEQDPGVRIEGALDAAGNIAARNIRAGTREVTPTYWNGKPVLDFLREAETAENVDAVLFIARDGTITFLDDGHRAVSPWDTVQVTFDDDGTDTPYQDIKVDYSDSFLANEWNVTKTGGTVYTASDATSIGEFLKRSQSITELPVTTTSDAEDVADALLAKYKDPLTRVTELAVVTKNSTIANSVIPLEIGDRIRVFRSPPGGGTRIDQTLFVQRIAIDGRPGEPWSVRLGVSPL